MKLLLVITFVLFSTVSVQAITLGTLKISGPGCTHSADQLKKISEADSLYSIPLNLEVKKDARKALERKVCMATLPIVLAKNEKLLIEDISQQVTGTGKAQLEVFLAGQKGQILKAESTNDSSQQLSQTGKVAESTCGGEVIVRANASGVVMGNQKLSVSFEELRLKLKVVRCEQTI